MCLHVCTCVNVNIQLCVPLHILDTAIIRTECEYYICKCKRAYCDR